MVMDLPLYATTYDFKGDLKKLPEFRSETGYVDKKGSRWKRRNHSRIWIFVTCRGKK